MVVVNISLSSDHLNHVSPPSLWPDVLEVRVLVSQGGGGEGSEVGDQVIIKLNP